MEHTHILRERQIMLQKRPLWRQTPPAIFPVCLGFLGLGLGWRNAAFVLPVPQEIGDLLLGLGMAYFLYFLAFYVRKVLARPSVVLDDMQSPAARAGVSAAAMTMMLLAAALLPLGVSVPQVWWCGVILQIFASAIGCFAIWKEDPQKRAFSPYQYLTFVGPVVGPIAGIPLGYIWQSIALTFAALVAYVIITAGWFQSLIKRLPETSQLPTLVIYLSPNCLFAVSFGLLNYDVPFYLFYFISNAIAPILIVFTLCKIRPPWSPAWASFTFPIGAFLQLQVLAVSKGVGLMAEIGVYVTMILGTPVVLGIAYRSVLAWVTGELAEKSTAAQV